MYKFQSEMTRPGPGIDKAFSDIVKEFAANASDIDKAVAIMEHIFKNFVYAPGVTNVKTTAEEALSGGSGVCQDYAHIMISLLRKAEIPARYIAGLMTGEGATHAWVEAWIEDRWVGFDPTHNRLVDDNYIKLTHGRNFIDGAVDKGCFTGYAAQSQQIYVKVEEVFDQ